MAMTVEQVQDQEASNSFHAVNHGHADDVRTVNYNFYGDLVATGSCDHRIKIWKRDNGELKLLDTWTAHDAEVFDIKWVSPQIGVALGSLGEDGLFKMWEEDANAALNSGRRFKCSFSMRSLSEMPYASFDFKHLRNAETYVALLSRDGLLSIWEAVDYDVLKEWRQVTSQYVCDPPGRGTEVSFKVHIEPAEWPCWTALEAGLNERSFGVATAGMDRVVVWRLNEERKLYPAAELPLHNGIVRDVKWADGSAWPHDLVTTACKDGQIRIFKMTTHPTPDGAGVGVGADPSTLSLNTPEPERRSSSVSEAVPPHPPQHQSGIGAGLATTVRSPDDLAAASEPHSGPVTHVVEQVASLGGKCGAAWQLRWFNMGKGLLSSHETGRLHTWLADLDGRWAEYANIEIPRD